MFESVLNKRAMGSMIFARIIYALNWMNFGAIFYLMRSDLGAGVSGLGNVTAAFYLGIGILQVPGGLLAAKWGARRVVVIGIFLFSVAALGTSVASNVAVIEVLRFVVGAGMAFVFAPGIVIIARLLRGGRSGIGVGLFNSAYDVGGLVAIFGWVLVAIAIGWRQSLAVSGALGIVTGVLTFVYVPKDGASPDFRVSVAPLVRVLKDTRLIRIGLGMIGLDIANTIISGFMILSLVDTHAAAGTVAAFVTSFITVVPIFAALWGGRMYDTISRHRTVMIAAILGSAVALVFASNASVYAALAGSVLGGLVSGLGYTFGFAGARDLNPAGKEYEGLAISWVNSIHLTGSFIPPVFFSYFVESVGYSQAWLWSAALTLVFLVPILLMAEHWRN